MHPVTGGKRKWQIAGFEMPDCPKCGRKIENEGVCGECGWREGKVEEEKKSGRDKKAKFGFKWSLANKIILAILSIICLVIELGKRPGQVAEASGSATATIVAAVFLAHVIGWATWRFRYFSDKAADFAVNVTLLLFFSLAYNRI